MKWNVSSLPRRLFLGSMALFLLMGGFSILNMAMIIPLSGLTMRAIFNVYSVIWALILVTALVLKLRQRRPENATTKPPLSRLSTALFVTSAVMFMFMLQILYFALLHPLMNPPVSIDILHTICCLYLVVLAVVFAAAAVLKMV